MGVVHDGDYDDDDCLVFQGRSTATAAWRGSTATATTASASTATARTARATRGARVTARRSWCGDMTRVSADQA